MNANAWCKQGQGGGRPKIENPNLILGVNWDNNSHHMLTVLFSIRYHSNLVSGAAALGLPPLLL